MVRPRYVEVTIDLPGEKDWSYADHSIRTWEDGPKYFIWRREANVFQSPESLVEYMDRQLVNNGWKRLPSSGWRPCDPVMAESNFLEYGKTYLAYQQQDITDEQEDTAPTLCLAVWPIENYDGFHVVIMTENPSLLTVWGND
jgi:hypothetical protein